MLHEKHAARKDNLDDTYASTDLSASMPKYKIPDGERDPRNICRLILDELMLDGNSRQNLATFCQTWVEPEVREIMAACLDKNMIDKDEYPQTAEIESAASTCWPICGTRRMPRTRWAVRRPDRARPRCWRAWR